MISPTLQKIDGIVSKIRMHPEYSGCVQREKLATLRSEANKHSFEIEYNLVATGQGDSSTFGKTSPRTLEGLTRAWDYLIKNGLTIHTMSNLGRLVEPAENKLGGFRTKEVQFGGFAPTAPNKIMSEMGNLVASLRDSYVHPVVRAVDAHIEIVRIHPYNDGNGRTARLVQNYCLEEKAYPPAIIPSTEDSLYRNLLGSALKDRYSNQSSAFKPSSAEKTFIEYVSSKVLSSAEALESELRSKRAFDVRFKGVSNPQIYYTAAKVLRGANKDGHHDGIKVKVEKKDATLHVLGDIGMEDISKKLETLSDKHGFKFNIKNLSCC